VESRSISEAHARRNHFEDRQDLDMPVLEPEGGGQEQAHVQGKKRKRSDNLFTRVNRLKIYGSGERRDFYADWKELEQYTPEEDEHNYPDCDGYRCEFYACGYWVNKPNAPDFENMD